MVGSKRGDQGVRPAWGFGVTLVSRDAGRRGTERGKRLAEIGVPGTPLQNRDWYLPGAAEKKLPPPCVPASWDHVLHTGALSRAPDQEDPR